MTPEERYRRDVAFKLLVDTLELEIERANYTPTELREAALLAAIHHEERRAAKSFIIGEGGPTTTPPPA